MLNLKIVPLESFNPPRQLAFRLLKAEQPGEAGMVCLALEDMEVPELKSSHQATSAEPAGTSALMGDVNAVQERLKRVGQGDLDLMSCDASENWRRNLADPVIKNEDVFSRHHLDCGEATGSVHRIRLTDERPFRLPYQHVHNQKDITRKSKSEFAHPNGDLWVCTNFSGRWKIPIPCNTKLTA